MSDTKDNMQPTLEAQFSPPGAIQVEGRGVRKKNKKEREANGIEEALSQPNQILELD